MRQSRTTPISTATPAAETLGAAGTAGTNGSASDSGHIHPMPELWGLVASDLTEYTMASATQALLATVAGLNMALVKRKRVTVFYRKTATAEGAAQTPGIGLGINGTKIFDPTASYFGQLSVLNQAEDGVAVFEFGGETANYRGGQFGYYVSRVTASGAQGKATTFLTPVSNLVPLAAVTDIEVYGISDTAVIPTVAIKGIYIEERL